MLSPKPKLSVMFCDISIIWGISRLFPKDGLVVLELCAIVVGGSDAPEKLDFEPSVADFGVESTGSCDFRSVSTCSVGRRIVSVDMLHLY
jgi:hypothetical protein